MDPHYLRVWTVEVAKQTISEQTLGQRSGRVGLLGR